MCFKNVPKFNTSNKKYLSTSKITDLNDYFKKVEVQQKSNASRVTYVIVRYFPPLLIWYEKLDAGVNE